MEARGGQAARVAPVVEEKVVRGDEVERREVESDCMPGPADSHRKVPQTCQ